MDISMVYVAKGLIGGLGALGGAIGCGLACKGWLEARARNPEGVPMRDLFITAGMADALGWAAIGIAFIL